MKILLIYASYTGTTRHYAEKLQKALISFAQSQEGIDNLARNLDIKLYDVFKFSAQELLSVDAFILASPTWDKGDVHINFAPFLREMRNLNLVSQLFAVFGAGNRSYQEFCEAVDILENRALGSQAKQLLPSFKINVASPVKDKEWDAWVLQLKNTLYAQLRA